MFLWNIAIFYPPFPVFSLYCKLQNLIHYSRVLNKSLTYIVFVAFQNLISFILIKIKQSYLCATNRTIMTWKVRKIWTCILNLIENDLLGSSYTPHKWIHSNKMKLKLESIFSHSKNSFVLTYFWNFYMQGLDSRDLLTWVCFEVSNIWFSVIILFCNTCIFFLCSFPPSNF